MAPVPRRLDAILAAVARGVLGEGYRPGVPARMRAKLAEFAPSQREELLLALAALDTRAGALALTGRPVPLSWLTAAEAERVLRSWLGGRIPHLRRLGRALVALAALALYGHEPAEWARFGYPGPMGQPPDEPRRLEPLPIEGDATLACDVVVVGSGAGGACAAARLAAAGLDVVVLEKGGYHAERDFTWREAEALSRMYLYGATLTTTDLGVLVLAGSTVGGGTVINYTTSFRTPPDVLREWASLTGIDAFLSGEFDASLDEVEERLGVNADHSRPGCRDELIERGLRALGWDVAPLPRAVGGCSQDDACGYCGFGCRIGAKRSAMRTYLEDAAARGVRIVAGADVRRVVIRDGRAIGVVAAVGRHRLGVRARAVVAAGGSIETPALLLRSGLRGRVGHGLHLHPGVAAFGVFDEPVRMWAGTLQARYSRKLRGLDGGYGPIFETVPVHPGLGSGAMPWVSARQHRDLMGRFGHLGLCAALPRDRSSGRVVLARDGSVRVRYRLGPDDEGRMVEGLVAAGKVMEAAGATEVFTMHPTPISYRPGSGGGHEAWSEEVRRAGLRGKVTSVSYHQMSSCAMGTDPATSVVGPDNESHEVGGLYVADASAFPTASGVNPMLTVYALAHRAARGIAARLA